MPILYSQLCHAIRGGQVSSMSSEAVNAQSKLFLHPSGQGKQLANQFVICGNSVCWQRYLDESFRYMSCRLSCKTTQMCVSHDARPSLMCQVSSMMPQSNTQLNTLIPMHIKMDPRICDGKVTLASMKNGAGLRLK